MLRLRPVVKKLNCVICEIVFFSQSQFAIIKIFAIHFTTLGPSRCLFIAHVGFGPNDHRVDGLRFTVLACLLTELIKRMIRYFYIFVCDNLICSFITQAFKNII